MTPASGFASKEAAESDAALNGWMIRIHASAGADFCPSSISGSLVGSQVPLVIPATGISVVRILVRPDLDKPTVCISRTGVICVGVVDGVLLGAIHVHLELSRRRGPAPNSQRTCQSQL